MSMLAGRASDWMRPAGIVEKILISEARTD